jgi:hypothetical protein
LSQPLGVIAHAIWRDSFSFFFVEGRGGVIHSHSLNILTFN